MFISFVFSVIDCFDQGFKYLIVTTRQEPTTVTKSEIFKRCECMNPRVYDYSSFIENLDMSNFINIISNELFI